MRVTRYTLCRNHCEGMVYWRMRGPMALVLFCSFWVQSSGVVLRQKPTSYSVMLLVSLLDNTCNTLLSCLFLLRTCLIEDLSNRLRPMRGETIAQRDGLPGSFLSLICLMFQFVWRGPRSCWEQSIVQPSYLQSAQILSSLLSAKSTNKLLE